MLLQSYQTILDRFGTPNDVQDSDGFIQWHYLTEGKLILVDFRDGLFVSVRF